MNRLKKALELRKHKYIKKKKGKGGKWEYTYKEFVGKRKGVDVKKISDGIRKAIKENPKRLTHGHTAQNAFWILKDGEVRKFKDRDIMNKKNVINVHSHSPENWKEAKKYKAQSFSGADLYVLNHMIKYGYGNTIVVIDARGIMDIFKGSDKIGKFTKRQCEFDLRLTDKDMNRIAEKYKIPVENRDKISRLILKEIAKMTGSVYLENVKWKI